MAKYNPSEQRYPTCYTVFGIFRIAIKNIENMKGKNKL